ncbi:MAG: helix-turn-helix domain-containing protein, partial [Enterococcus sp.]|nr:helix-turn-helix domain-containing protein [Enterococcus sp.]
MDIYDLLDNSETIQLKILRKIFSAGEKGVACAEVRRSLKINANTVLEAVGLFNDFFKETYVDRKVAINYTSETGLLTLDTEENIDFSEIYSTFLRRSINYQIIQKVSFESSSISQLAVRLYLSEATIFRKIKLLNSKIEEFQLKIKNVKMHGDEIQIRYLLYSLTVNAYTFNQHLLKFQ